MVKELGRIGSQKRVMFTEGEQRKSQGSSLSSSQMESLTFLCNTFLPSIYLSNDSAIDKSVNAFYQTSASMAGTPQEVAELITERLQHPKLHLIRLVLWMLSTRVGTFILCGRRSLSSHFPYLQRFSKVCPEKREEIVQSWAVSYFYLIRMFFVGMKMLTLLVFFTQVNDKNENLSWKAIGYCGPDPEFKTSKENGILRSESEDGEKEGHDPNKEHLFGPLHNKGLINLNKPRKVVAEILRQSGFSVVANSHQKITRTSLSPSLIVKCDAVVVGSGSGGGVVAGVLAESGYKVLVLEKGQYYARRNLSLLEGPTMNQMYLGNGLLATDDMGVVILAGSSVGGGSTINWSASIRTPEHVCKEWCEQHKLELFGSGIYKEAMDIVCEKMGVQREVKNEGFNSAVLRQGCEELGFPVKTIPRNSPADHYCGWCGLGCRDGRKKGTSETWLVELLNSGNGAILPQCEAIQVLHKKEGRKGRSIASGVAFEFQHNGVKEVGIVESKVTVIACGALCTPLLLKSSSLKNPNIGKNLRLHPVTMAWGYFPDTRFSNKKSYEGGIMTAMSTIAVNSNQSAYGALIQTPSLHPGMFSVLAPWVSGADIKKRMRKFSRTANIFALARDKGLGEVASSSSISYRMDSVDEENLQKGLEKVLRILAAAGAEEIGTQHCNGKSLKVKEASSDEFERFVREESSRPLGDLSKPLCSAHQMGSCRMGVEPRLSAVNQRGETWEMERLYVADSSVFPTALGVNPMVTVQAIAYCTAQSVLEDLKGKNILQK